VKNTNPIFPIILVLVGLGAGFFGGIQYRNYQINKARTAVGGAAGTFQRFTGTRTGGAAGQNGMMRGGTGAVSGSVLSMDANSITVKLADGSSKIVLFSTSTTYSNIAVAAQTDLKVGSEVAVFGAANSDGSVTATSVQINPQFGRGTIPSPTP
jgi:hypothetical protein